MLRLLYTFAFRKHIRLRSLYQKANDLENYKHTKTSPFFERVKCSYVSYQMSICLFFEAYP